MKYIILTIICSMLGVLLQGQIDPPSSSSTYKEPVKTKKIDFGLFAGASYSTISYRIGDQGVDLYNTYRIGPTGGLFVEFGFSNLLSLRMAAAYSDKGDRTNGDTYVANWQFPQDNSTVYSAEGSGKIDKVLGYADFELMPLFTVATINDKIEFQLGAGVYAGYGIRGQENVDMTIDYYRNGTFDETEEIIKTNDVVFVNNLITEEKEPGTLYYNKVDFGYKFYMGIKPRPFNVVLSYSFGQGNMLSTSFEELFYSSDSVRAATNRNLTLTIGYIF